VPVPRLPSTAACAGMIARWEVLEASRIIRQLGSVFWMPQEGVASRRCFQCEDARPALVPRQLLCHVGGLTALVCVAQIRHVLMYSVPGPIHLSSLNAFHAFGPCGYPAHLLRIGHLGRTKCSLTDSSMPGGGSCRPLFMA
jgi:hypothetical protein